MEMAARGQSTGTPPGQERPDLTARRGLAGEASPELQGRATFAPARSRGALFGGCLAAGCLAVSLLLIASTVASPSPTRWLAFGLALALVAIGAVGLVGALQCRRLRYVLGPDAFEVHTGLGTQRIRYDQI